MTLSFENLRGTCAPAVPPRWTETLHMQNAPPLSSAERHPIRSVAGVAGAC